VLVSTDGVWEAQNEAEKQFGKDRVRQVLRASACSSAQEIAEALRLAVRTFCGSARQLDDITFIVARRT
jgi:sigma-B regulation protein RsbU (phosphoserine phosphatase)